jgi:hypothetical protein
LERRLKLAGMNEKARFAQRLRAALVAAGHEPKPAFVHKQFNSRWRGRPISFQAARAWLIGASMPEQDKLQVLAEWLNVPPQSLRYGEHPGVREPIAGWAGGVSAQDRAMIEALLALPAAQRRLVSELIRALASARG